MMPIPKANHFHVLHFQLYLSIGELYLDEMVHTVLRPFTFVSKRSRGPKKVDAEGFAKLECLFQRWLVRAGQSLQSFITDEASNANQDRRTAAASLRYISNLSSNQYLGEPEN